jgi:AbrB family looped-hinge helix DNA binding protein
MKITSKGQVTIPQHIRERYGMMPGTEIEFAESNGHVIVRPASHEPSARAKAIVERMRGSGHGRMTTDEIMELMRGHK